MALQETARAKINLALHVLGRREDGYHELDSIVAFAEFGDALTVEEAAEDSLTITGPFAATLSNGPDNLVMKALSSVRELLRSLGQEFPPLSVTLEKKLPIASGIGGGSADAAATLRLALRLANVQVPPDQFLPMMTKLGADVPVCFHQQTCRMQGIGEIITPVLLPSAHMVLINPMKPCSTASVFNLIGLAKGQKHGSPIDFDQPKTWRNDLLPAASSVEPSISEVLGSLAKRQGMVRASMSGSGATCFAIMDGPDAARDLVNAISKYHPDWWVRHTILGE